MDKILITGANGYLGRGLRVPFEGKCALRLMDVTPFEHPEHEVVVGSVAEMDTVRQAVAGTSGIVVAHMASRQAGSYQTPEVPFDANVKGTANLLQAAVEEGIKRVVLISSTGVTHYQGRRRPAAPAGAPSQPRRTDGHLYGLTKVCQETIAQHYHQEHGLQVAVLRIGCVMDAETMVDKYGRKFVYFGLSLTERRDIGEAARLALKVPDLGYEVFTVISTREAAQEFDMEPAYRRLGWQPQYDFSWLPRDPQEINAGQEPNK